MAGLETGLGNRSYRSLYPGRSSSARCIDRLLNAGAVLVGKTKTSQFAEGEVPIQWYEFLPRGPIRFPPLHIYTRQRYSNGIDGRQGSQTLIATVITPATEPFEQQPPYSTDKLLSMYRQHLHLCVNMYCQHSFALLGLSTSPPSTLVGTRTNHRLLQAPALLSLRLPTLGSTSPLELTLGAPLAIRQVFVVRMECDLPPMSSPQQAYIRCPRSLTALECSQDLLPSLKLSLEA